MSKFAYWKLSALLLAAHIFVNFLPIIQLMSTCAGGEGSHCGG